MIYKAELVKNIKEKTSLSTKDIASVIDAAAEIIKAKVAEGERVNIKDFGTFKPSKRAARNGHNPRTKEPIIISERTVPRFMPGKSFKEIVNK